LGVGREAVDLAPQQIAAISKEVKTGSNLAESLAVLAMLMIIITIKYHAKKLLFFFVIF
jgi:hypothetical protein